jgi:hypothetical protein
MPIIIGVQTILDGSRTAVLVPAVTRDRVRLTPDGDWISIDDIELGTEVYEVNHFGQHTSQKGSTWSIKDLLNRELTAQVVICTISLERANQLTDAQLATLGPRLDQGILGFDSIEQMEDRRVWYVSIIPESNNQYAQ